MKRIGWWLLTYSVPLMTLLLGGTLALVARRDWLEHNPDLAAIKCLGVLILLAHGYIGYHIVRRHKQRMDELRAMEERWYEHGTD